MAKETPRAKAIRLLQKLVRLEEADDQGYCTCVTCGDVKHWKEGDGGHFIAKGDSSRFALERDNIHFQCSGCNSFGMRYGSASQAYTLWMVDNYGREFVNDMLSRKNEIHKLYKHDYIEMIDEFNKKILFHRKRVGDL